MSCGKARCCGRRLVERVVVACTLLAICLLLLGVGAGAALVPKVVQASWACGTPNAEVEQAVSGRYVYEVWMGCGGRIGFSRSVNGGGRFGPAQVVLGTERARGWDPALAVAPDGTVYVSYMIRLGVSTPGSGAFAMIPVVAVSLDHGRSFARISHLPVPLPTTANGNWGDRDFIAVGSDGTLYVTWDYGPSYDEVGVDCSGEDSCVFSRGDFNAVVQKSADGGKTWTMPRPISPGFPLGGAFSAPIVVEPNGTLAVLYWGHPTDPSSLTVGPGTDYFTSSSDGGATWSSPVAVDPGAGRIALSTWWIDGSLAVDSAGTLYATWDTQTDTVDTAWLAWSSDGGKTWSPPLRVTSGSTERLTEVAAADTRSVYVAWQTPGRKGYATYLRRLAVGEGWTGPAKRISRLYGDVAIWPGDTFGLSTQNGAAMTSWGTSGEIYATRTTLPPHVATAPG
jgi:BNR repeat-like domain